MSISVDSNTTNIQPTRKAVVGFDPVHFVEEPPKSFFCPLCEKVLRNPVQTVRGEDACSECYHRHKGDKNICPIDNKITDDSQLFPDRAREGEILRLSVRCFYQKLGCEWTGKLKNLEDHKIICEHAPVKCDQCGETVPSIAEHYRQCSVPCSRVVCPFAMVDCKHQMSDSNTTNIQPTRKAVVGFDPVHIVEKPPESFFCPLCDNVLRKPVQTARGEIACSECYYRHKGDKNICPIDNEIIDESELFPDRAKEREILTLSVRCFYQKFGCEWTGKLKNLEDHASICEHAPVKCDQYQAESKLDLCTHIQNSLQIHNRRIVNHIESVSIENTNRLMEAVYKINELNRVLRRQNDTLAKQVDSMKDLLDQVLNKLDGKETGNSGAKTGEKARQNNAGMTQSNESSQKKGTSKGASEDPANVLVEQVEKNKQGIRQMNSTISNLSTHLSNVNLRHQLHENATHDGHMLWRIDALKQRMKQAINGKTTALHSEPMFSKKYGYKFCCHMYLNGDGKANIGKYISLYFVLMRSEFDNLLDWPFEKKVFFTLKNQIDQSRDIRKVLNADPKSTSFRKPQKQMSPAMGYPQFVLQSKLNESGFVKDDCFYLEIQVQ